ncbi:MAG: response regulator [Treponemataceae bacterium]|nr:response regulator [Treponemataceae bacterium]
MKVLFADDDNTMRLYFTKFFEKKGYETDSFSNGAEAWEAVQKNYYPLVVLDWNMPEMSGVEVCERIKAMPSGKFVYVMLITSNSSSEEIIEGLNRGADDYITKPVVAAELEARIGSALRVIEYERQLQEKEQATRFSCYQTLTELAETRDQESKDHMNRVGLISELLGMTMGLKSEFCTDLRIFAPMHDIGKVGIPDGILHIPRHLCSEEFDLIKLHTTIGWEILKGKDTFEMGSTIAYTHHEHWDGSGYPRHLKGESIPLEGRITAVADTYDSMRSVKSYSAAVSHEDCMKYLVENAGILFDPKVISAAVQVQDQLNSLFNRTYRVNIQVKP